MFYSILENLVCNVQLGLVSSDAHQNTGNSPSYNVLRIQIWRDINIQKFHEDQYQTYANSKADAVLGLTLELRLGLTLHKVALDWGQPKLFYVKPISTKSKSSWIILLLFFLVNIFWVNFLFWPENFFDKNFFCKFFFSENCFTNLFWQKFCGAKFFFGRKFCV